MLLYDAALRRAKRAKADLIEAVAWGYKGARAKDAAPFERLVHALRDH